MSDNSGAEEQDTHPLAWQVGPGDHSPLPSVCHYLVMCAGDEATSQGVFDRS